MKLLPTSRLLSLTVSPGTWMRQVIAPLHALLQQALQQLHPEPHLERRAKLRAKLPTKPLAGKQKSRSQAPGQAHGQTPVQAHGQRHGWGLPANRADAVWQDIERGIAQTVPAAAHGVRNRFARNRFCQPRRLLVAAALGLLGMSAAHALEITDDRGRTLHFERPAMRVVSLLPSLTESVCALDACSRLVGVDRYSDWPAQVQRLPKVGGGLDPSIEAIVALRPDVVLASDSSRATDRLSALGIKVVALQTQTHADVRKGLVRIAALLGLPANKADAVWQDIGRGIAQAAQTVPAAARGKRVFIEVSRGPFAAGESSFIGETLSALGMQNVVPSTQGPFPKLNPEFVVRADPDLLMFTNRAAQDNSLYPGWQQLRAVRQQQVCRFDQQESNLLIHPSPRMAEGASVLARCITQKLGQARR